MLLAGFLAPPGTSLATVGLVRATSRAKARSHAVNAPPSDRTDTDISLGWRFHLGDVANAWGTAFDDSHWTVVDVPHTWNNLDGADGSPPPYNPSYYQGPSWYRKTLTVPATAPGQRLTLQFDGVNLVADIWVNGIFLGEHRGGYTAFRFDATSTMVPGGTNTIAVEVNNAINPDVAPLGGDYTFFGGMYRAVHILVTDDVHISLSDGGGPGVELQQSQVSASSAHLEVMTLVANQSSVDRTLTVESVVADASSTVVADLTDAVTVPAGTDQSVTQSSTLSPVNLWQGRASPYLYHVSVLVEEGGLTKDAVSQPLGFRWYSIDPNTGFSLNGQPYDLHGVNFHQDRLGKGWAVSDADLAQDFGFVQEIGATVVRLSHYNHAQKIYDLADQTGVAVWAENPVIKTVTGDSAFADNAVAQLQELIRQNINHPSVIVWSIANEVTRSPSDPGPLLATLNQVAHSEDPSRPTTLAAPATAAGSPTTAVTDVVGYNAYYGWYSGTTADLGPWADAAHAANPGRAIGVSEFGAGSSRYIHSDQPVAGDHSEEYQARFNETYWQTLESRPYLWTKMAWNLFDFAVDGRHEGDTAGRNDKGLVSYDRKSRKDSFYWFQANWTTTPMVHITSANWGTRDSSTTTVKVYSNASTVELKLNGVSLGTRNQDGTRIFLWPVTLRSGANAVSAVARSGATRVVDSVNWTVAGGFPNSVRIDVGSAVPYLDSQGNTWSADTFAQGGSVSSASGGVAGTADSALFQTYRIGNFSYHVPLANGTYTVRLLLMEPQRTSSGSRVMAVSAQGQTAQFGLDIFAAVGAHAALTETCTVAVTDNVLNLSFQPTKGQAIVSAISVTP